MADNKAIVAKLLDALWNKGQLSVADELVSKDFVGYWPFRAEPVKGPVGYKDLVAELWKVFPDQKMRILDQIAEGDKVVTRFEVTGTHRAEFLTAKPTYKTVTVEGLGISRIVNGKIVETYVQVDSLALLRGLGIVSPKITMPASAVAR